MTLIRKAGLHRNIDDTGVWDRQSFGRESDSEPLHVLSGGLAADSPKNTRKMDGMHSSLCCQLRDSQVAPEFRMEEIDDSIPPSGRSGRIWSLHARSSRQ